VILYPAIDLKDGACVRLVRGEMATATVFNEDPAAQARQFEAAGFGWLHIVDLNGAFAGHSVNGAAVTAIRDTVRLRIQLGGGIRDLDAIERWLSLGIDRVVLGTAALRDPELVRRAAADYPSAHGSGRGCRQAADRDAARKRLAPRRLPWRHPHLVRRGPPHQLSDWPMSSPQITRIFGLRLEGVAGCCACAT